MLWFLTEKKTVLDIIFFSKYRNIIPKYRTKGHEQVFSVQRSDFVALHVSNKTWSLDVSKVPQVSESMRWFILIVPNLGENWDNLSKYGVMWYSTMESKPYYEVFIKKFFLYLFRRFFIDFLSYILKSLEIHPEIKCSWWIFKCHSIKTMDLLYFVVQPEITGFVTPDLM